MDARPLVFAALPLLVTGCDNKARNEEIATVEKKDAPDPELDKRMAERKQKREAEERAKAEAAERKRAAIEALAVAPAKLPKKLDQACEAVAAAHDRFMQRHHTGAALEAWTAAKDEELPMTVVQCASANRLDVAACQASALDNASAELANDATAILQACVGKYAPKGPPPGMQPGGAGEIPKKPGG